MSAVIQDASPYARLLALPETLVGEIIGGELYAQPRPAGPHAVSASALGGELYGFFHKGRGGPGGWWIIDEPEVHFVRDTEVLVPDIAGWRRERMPNPPQDHRFEIVPDWLCEILSPATQRKDRVVKMKVYARYEVAYLWLVDPFARILETYALDGGHWSVTGLYQDQDEVCAPPFEAVTLALGDLWGGS
ncbi:Uma2 family endonuclease [Methylococcus geothermalis]|uniref:Uma2 family endonuclease n=1 Tax=Methylococcus geothermalis TaxID=2681310 RepID=A0A858QAB3_9GAMM|nr:Uma2 family endonuclease [Methylococcus geothermalis]QJD30872.1 Uma2 family endonuclease [Methylococcus geothermalis]